MSNFRRIGSISIIFIAAIAIHNSALAQVPERVGSLADEYVQLRIEYDPTLAAAVGIPSPAGMHFPDRSRRAIRALHRREDALLAKLKQVSPSDRQITAYSVLLEELQSRRALRVCHAELWDLSQTEGWQVEFPALSASQLVETPLEREQVLKFWSTLPDYLATSKENLRAGLAAGYSVPKSVVVRVLKQLDGLLAVPVEASPFFSPAKRANDPEYVIAFRRMLEGRITPALRQYADFLRTVYLPRARESVGLSAIPNGANCYRAYLRRYTTTDHTPEFIYSSGRKLVAESIAEIRAIGSRLYHSTDFATILQRSHDDPANRFVSPEQLLQFSKDLVERSGQMSRSLFLQLPSQPVAVTPLPAYQRGTGVGSHYQSNPDMQKPATFWISMDDWSNETRGAAEITAVHETVPGHHLQNAMARQWQSQTGLAKIVFNAAFSEGWANYAERLAEEQGIDGDDFERIQRRVLAGRSLVIDPGIHFFGWTRRQAESFAAQTGMSREQADDLIDRIAVEPGQLTSYEVGGLEILALQQTARIRLGAKFELPAFHQRVLENGLIPLNALRNQVNGWIASQTSCSRRNCSKPETGTSSSDIPNRF